MDSLMTPRSSTTTLDDTKRENLVLKDQKKRPIEMIGELSVQLPHRFDITFIKICLRVDKFAESKSPYLNLKLQLSCQQVSPTFGERIDDPKKANSPSSSETENCYLVLFSGSSKSADEAIGDGLRNFEPLSSEEDDTCCWHLILNFYNILTRRLWEARQV
ncbi:hypothetical protein TNCV_4696841 [Trichonephila clavipes]|nr:hypothetical protein TNCV_4696841 [Trichonephila clavipes]